MKKFAIPESVLNDVKQVILNSKTEIATVNGLITLLKRLESLEEIKQEENG
jgi:hypothetical protein